MATKKRKTKKQTRTRKTTKSPNQKDSPFDRKTDKRVLQYFNAARATEDLMALRPDFFAEVQPLGRGRPQIQEPATKEDPVPLFDRKTAERLLRERDRISPLHGFWHFDQIKRLLDASTLKRVIFLLLRYFSRIRHGEWTTHGDVTIGGQSIVPRHAALLRTGNVIMIEGACSDVTSRTWLWNPYTRTMVTPAPTLPAGKFNLYCSGHSFLRDGRLLAYGGGGESYTPGPKNDAWIFDPGAGTWDFTKDTVSNTRTPGKEERWYPTLVTLGDHRVLVASGSLSHLGCGTNTTPPPMKMEIYDESTGRFEHVTTPADKFFRPTYPGLHLLPNNQIFFAPVGFRDFSELTGACVGNEPSSLLSLIGLNGNWNDIGANDRTKGMSVLLHRNSPPYVRVMVVGGGDSGTSRTYAMADLSTPTPNWGDDLQLPLYGTQAQPTQRIHPNVVLLPDGTVFVAGGAAVTEPCLLYDPNPASPGWSKMDELHFERRYHSFALLLPTAEVMASGGRGQGTAGVSTIEVFRPPYLFKGAQPTISPVTPDSVHHGHNFTITTPNAGSVARVTLVRPMAVTHQTDSEQRVIELCWAPGTTANTITATAPSPTHPHGLAPRGWYMLFIINNIGVPSNAKFIHLH